MNSRSRSAVRKRLSSSMLTRMDRSDLPTYLNSQKASRLVSDLSSLQNQFLSQGTTSKFSAPGMADNLSPQPRGHETGEVFADGCIDVESPPVTPDPRTRNGTSLSSVRLSTHSLDSSSSSVLTELSESSSFLETASKATTPLDVEQSKLSETVKTSHRSAPISFSGDYQNLHSIVQPKSSIPGDISLHQYATECLDAAESSRLNPFALHPEEYEILRHHISHAQVTTYLNIRNSILRLWLKQPWAAVTREQAVGCANLRWFDAASVCYDWLVRRGYINYGCVKLPTASEAKSSSSNNTRRSRTVAVIGAGISGLACARQLEALFHQYAARFTEKGEDIPRVIVVEGRGRIGGRVYSRQFHTKSDSANLDFAGERHTAEMGGMIITGFERGNPVNVLVRGQLGIPYHALRAETTIYDSDGKPVDPVRDGLVEKLFNDCLDRVSEYKFKTRPSKLIEGNRSLMEEGRDSPGDGSRTIMQVEEATAALPDALPVAQQSVPEKVNLVPVSADKLTGRVHNQPGVAASEKVAGKAEAMGWKLNPGINADFDLRLEDAVSMENPTLGSVLDHALTRYKSLVSLVAQDYRLINWHVANLEYSNATSLRNLSLSLWDIDAGNEWEGHHTMVIGGYQSLARGLLQCPTPLDLTTRFAVKTIKYHAEGFDGPATLQSENGDSVEADVVVCTIPLGVLKHGAVQFEPPLPAWKSASIGRLGFGILNKVVLVYKDIFWDPDRHIFGILRDPLNPHSTSQEDYTANRGRFFQWFNVTKTTGLPCLIALMAGEAGFETERSSDESLIEEATEILRGVFGSDVPYPVESIVTRWGSDRFARGSYSSAAPGMQPDDYDSMARPIGNLVFAGEHTIGTHPATVHGAYLSGIRAASDVLDGMLGPIEVPTPLVLPKDSLVLSSQKRRGATKDPRQARLEAYESEICDYIRAEIGDRPNRPTKLVVNAYLLYSKEHFEAARKRCEENRKPGKGRSTPNDVRMMTSRMWKEATPEQRQPYEEMAALQKKAFSEALLHFTEAAQKWDERAIALRAEYEQEHPSLPGPDEIAEERATPNKYRRARYGG